MELRCVNCEVLFEAPKKSRGRHRRVCSEKCKAEWSKSQWRPRHAAARRDRRIAAGLPWYAGRKLNVFKCIECGAEFKSHQHKASCCSKKCLKKALARTAKAKAHKANESKRKYASKRDRYRAQNYKRRAAVAGFEQFNPREVFERDGWRCQICGRPVNRRLRHPHPMSATLDHITPLSRGGAHSKLNSQCAHLSCNSRKHNRLVGQLRLFG